MSYSFNVKGATKLGAAQKAVEEMNKVVSGQPIHAKDKEAVLATVENVLDVLQDDPERDVSLSVNGYVSWTEGDQITQVSVQVAASLVAKTP